jgi:4-amino-4-deoxychorismate lyase
MVLVNGTADGALSATDRGLAYGDGVFRTLAVRDGHAVAWVRQYAKLQRDCLALRIACPPEPELRDDLARVASAQRECAVKIIVTRGEGRRGYAVPEKPARPLRIVIPYPFPDYPHDYARRGVVIRRCALRLGSQPALAGIKHLNRLENVLARMEWADPQIAEGLLLDHADNVIGGTMTNLFIVEGNVLATPDLVQCGVAGVTRERVMEAAAAHGVSCRVESFGLERVKAAQEVFLVNSLIGVWPVRRFEDSVWRAGKLSTAVRRWLDEKNT